MPAAYTTAQKAAIQQFMGITQLDKSAAARTLKQHNWNVQAATNEFYGGGGSAASPQANVSKPKLSKLFDGYRENAKEDPDEVNMEGMMKMMGDMDVNIESVDMLVFSQLVGSPTLGKVTREGFVDGLSAQGISDSSKISNLITTRRSTLSSDRALLKQVYKHTFTIARTPGQKSVALEAATEYWRLLFTSPSLAWSTSTTPWLEWWIDFLQDKWKKSVNKDMWDQTLVFAEKTLQDEAMTFWSEDSAWPGVIDEFVDFVQTKRKDGDAMDVS